MNEYISSIVRNTLKAKKDDFYALNTLCEITSMPSFRFAEAFSNPFIYNGKPFYMGTKFWDSIIDGTLNLVKTENN